MIENKNIAYFLGIGGIGMSALARYFRAHNWHVYGYDRTATTLTRDLVKEGIFVHYTDSIESIPDPVRKAPREKLLLVYTPAIPASHEGKKYFDSQGYTLYKRSQVLGYIASLTRCLAVAGTHGKTTTSTLLAHILHSAEIPCNAFLGGIAANFNSNILLHPMAAFTVVEADEYDRSFLQLSPTLAVITSMDPDHLDIYGTPDAMHHAYNEFALRINKDGRLIYKKDLPLKSSCPVFTYSLSDESCDYHATGMKVEEGRYTFGIKFPGGECTSVTSGLPGSHNVENAVAAFAAAHQLGVSPGKITQAIASYLGVRRRFEYRVRSTRHIYIDDYAHHPEEIRACVNSVRQMYPGKKLTVVFQPHLFTRTRDFASGFASALAAADQLFLLDIYPAREKPLPGITSQWLLNKIEMKKKELINREELLNRLAKEPPSLLLTLGAGDIDTLAEPITSILSAS